MISYIVRHISSPERDHSLAILRQDIPTLIVVEDTTRNAMDTFLAALAHPAAAGPVVHLEDDIVVCENFVQRAEEVIERFPTWPIQFFSRSKKDGQIGRGYPRPPSSFSMNQAFYLPPGVSQGLLEFAPTWARREEHPTGYDLMMADAFKLWKTNYWNHVPSLVQHRVGQSLIDRRRAWSRQSPTFEGGML